MNCFEAHHTDNLAPWTLLDGGMGRELLKQGAPFRQPQWSALALMEAPETVLAVHRAFIAAGAQVITTNSYALVPFHLGAPAFYAHGQQWADLAGRLARQAVQESRRNVRVAASLPPLFGSYQPALFDVVRAPEIAQRLIAGLAPYADIWLAETLSSIQEAEFIQSMLPESSQPFWVSFTLADEAGVTRPILRSGEPVAEATQAMLSLGVDALLFNCSAPETMLAAIQTAQQVMASFGQFCPIGVYANAFCSHDAEAETAANEYLDDMRPDLTIRAYAALAEQWLAAGATLIGGCCGIGPEYIRALADLQCRGGG